MRTSWCCAMAVTVLAAAAGERASAQLPWEAGRWRIEARDSRVERHEGREGLYLDNGVAWLEGVRLEDGVIRFDLHAGPELGFHGVAFRAADDRSYEHFYLRPFVSGNPDASQYTPVSHGVSGWQIYSGPRFSLPVRVPSDRWVHVELRVLGSRAEAYVDGQPLVFPALQRPPRSGAIGLTSSGAPTRFANVVVTPDPPDLEAGEGAPPEPHPPGMVAHWRVSTPFAESRLDSLAPLAPALAAELEWEILEAGERGIADLARARPHDVTNNTVFAAVRLRASAPRPARVRFGFSDRVHMYLNGRPIYRGADGWRSRDYRFLGTVGLFDEVVLDLDRGDNELWLAVSEDFGGWAVAMQLVDRDGVEVGAP